MADLSRFNRRIDTIPRRLREAVIPTLQKQADEMVTAMRAVAPRDEGALIESIRKEAGGDELQVVVRAGNWRTKVKFSAGHEEDYALIQEYGRKNAAARPFFWPTWRVRRRRVGFAIRRAIARAIREGNV